MEILIGGVYQSKNNGLVTILGKAPHVAANIFDCAMDVTPAKSAYIHMSHFIDPNANEVMEIAEVIDNNC
jgi:hypothetical protein